MNREPKRLNEIIFSRSTMTYDMRNLYHQNTDVWVLGSAQSYLSLVRLLDKHANSVTRQKRLLAESDSSGMDLLVLPACRTATEPFLLLQERIVYQAGRLNMELMIGGSSEGFATLSAEFSKLLAEDNYDPDDHQHVDDNMPILLQPSVFLNIRGPVKNWTEKALGHYWKDFVLSHDSRLPKYISHDLPTSSSEYDVIGYDEIHARLPISNAS